MSTSSRRACLLLSAALGLLVPVSAHAAKVTQVSGWNGGVSLPSDVTMSIYVPDKVAANPPLVTVVHYCGGNAQAVFGQAKDISAAADKYGFIIILPAQTHSGGCWDVSSKQTQTHDGGGDTHAIAQMVRYTITQYKANANRVYSTGDSSGGMMTELLMAVYPDIFKAGSSFAGVPAGCSNVFDGSGLCGLSAQTAQQWGDRVRAMYPGYTGHRPRVQLFHGDADGTITYKNETEAIKEWTNVLGLSSDPTVTVDSGLTLGTHQAKRQEWKNSCGYVVLDFLTSVGGDHGPSDALFQGNFVLPFLGLDSQAAVDAALDPEIVQCGGGNESDGGVSTPDASKDGSMGGSGGSMGGSGGRMSGSGGNTGNGGNSGSGGSSGNGGSSGMGGSSGIGGSSGKGGGGGSSSTRTGTGGSGSGGISSTNVPMGSGGSKDNTGGASGAPSSGGTSGGSSTSSSTGGNGGSSSAGGTGGSAGTSSSSSQGAGGASNADSGNSSSSGCGCSLGASRTSTSTVIMALALALLAFFRKRR